MSDQHAREIADGVYQLPTDYPQAMDGPLWVYLIRDSSTALIDAGIASTLDTILGTELRRLAIDPTSIGQVILTHGHFDHCGGSGPQKAVSGALIAAPLDDAAWIEDPERQWRELWDGYPGALSIIDSRDAIVGMCGNGVRIDQPLRDGDVLQVGDRRLGVIQARGHSRGHLAFLDPRTGCLFTGDAIGGGGIRSSSDRQTFSPMYEDVEDYRASLRRLREIPFTLLCPAHLEPVGPREAQSLIDVSLGFVDQVDALVRDMILSSDHPIPTRMVAARIGQLVGSEPLVNMGTVTVAVAHLKELARAGLTEEAWGATAIGAGRVDR